MIMMMRTAFALVSLVAAACSAGPVVAVGAAPSTVTQAIINGAQCTEQTDPTAMAVLIDATLNFGGQTQDITTVICTGTLIAPDTVLTAAHCTDPSALAFGFGTVDRADYYVTFQSDLAALANPTGQGPPPAIPESAVPVRALVANEQFDLNNLNGGVNGPGDFKDVALLFLSTTIDDVDPELIITADEARALTAGAPVEIAGWGQQTQTANAFTPPPPGTVGLKVCGASTINELGDFEMQIGGDGTTTRKCHGDSGGPTYIDVGGDHKKTRRVIGITSHAYDQSDCGKGGIDTRVDVWRDWIDGKMKAGCADGSRAWCDVAGVIPSDFFDPHADPTPPKPVGAKKGCASAPPFTLGALALALLTSRRRASRTPRRSS